MSEPKRSSKFDLIAEHYDATRGGIERGRRQAALLAPFLRRDRPVLDIGAGTGVVALGLTELGYQVIGVDLSRGMLCRALDRLDGRAVAGDALALPFVSASFDQAYSVWVLHHVGDMAGALREVARVLRPHGRYGVLPQGARPVGERDPALQLVEQMRRRLMRERPWAGNADDLPELAPQAGLRMVEVRDLEPHSYEESPESQARALENRAYSYLVDVDDETWKREVEPTIAAIRALPNPEQPVKRWAVPPPMVILERPLTLGH